MINNLETLMKKADFSKETDLKDRLREQLFSSKVRRFPTGSMRLSDDDLSQVSAAGEVSKLSLCRDTNSEKK